MQDKRSEYRLKEYTNSIWYDIKVQYKPWWCPIWLTCWGIGMTSNAFHLCDIAKAEKFAKRHAELNQSGDLRTIKKLGRLP